MAQGAFICPGCDFILDTSFLGDDITDDQRDTRLKQQKRGERGSQSLFGEDAIILGNGSDGEWSDFAARDAGMTREVTQARFYVGGNTAALLSPDAVPEVVPGVLNGSLKMTPFERHVLQFINGKRSIGRIQKKSAMEETEFKTSVALLADKGMIRLRTVKKKKNKSALSQMPSSTSQSNRLAPAEGGERTVVAPFALPDPDQPPPGEKSVARGAPTKEVEKPKSSAPGFASMRVHTEHDDGTGEWGDGEHGQNISNVFARASVRLKRPSLADEEPPAERVAKEPPRVVNEPSRVAKEPSRVEREPSRVAKEPSRVEREPSRVHAKPAPPPPPPDEPNAAATGADADEEDGIATGPRATLQRTTAPAVPEGEDADGFPAPTGIGDLKPIQMRGGEPLDADAQDDDGDAWQADDEQQQEEEERQEEERQEEERQDEEDARHDEQDERQDEEDEQQDEEQQEDDEDIDEPSLPTARLPGREPLSDEPTGPPPDHPDDEVDGFDVSLDTAHLEKLSKQETASLPQRDSLLPELPSDALQPLPSASAPAAPAPAAQRQPSAIQIIKPLPLPGQTPIATQAPPLPGQTPIATQAPPLPGQTPIATQAPPGALPLPGQPLVQPKPGVIGRGGPAPAPHRPPTAAGVVAPRPSAQSKAPHEQARKAEKIFEQAIKDHAEGRISSALQNAKLAVMFDSTVPAYKEFLTELTSLGAAARSPNAGKPRELLLFEEANEAEGRGEFDKAVKLLEEAIEIAPKTAALRNRLGVVLSIRLKRHEEALAHLKVAIDLEPGNIVYMNNFSKVTAMLDSQLEKAPEKKKKLSFFGGGEEAGKVEIKKIRPKMF